MRTYQSNLHPSPWRAAVKIAAVAVTLIIIGRCAIMTVSGLPKVLEQGCAVRMHYAEALPARRFSGATAQWNP